MRKHQNLLPMSSRFCYFRLHVRYLVVFGSLLVVIPFPLLVLRSFAPVTKDPTKNRRVPDM